MHAIIREGGQGSPSGAKEWHEQKHRRRRMQWRVESSHLALSLEIKTVGG